MPDIILHHYWISPYAEKIRRILGFKGLAWKSVEIPIVAPKPDLTALTGGYRKTPVLQIGADIYCDTDRIARVLEAYQPTPTLFPAGASAAGTMFGAWQQELFMLAVLMAGASGLAFPEGFVEDRATMFEGGFDLAEMLEGLPAKRDHLRAKLALIEQQLDHGRPFLLGDDASLADFAIFHPVFTLRSLPATAPLLEPYPTLSAWMDRIEAFGHGQISELSAADAIAIAHAATPATPTVHDTDDPNARKPGERISIVHETFGRDPVAGELVASSADEIALRRTDARAGEVVVHFPREHYVVTAADA